MATRFEDLEFGPCFDDGVQARTSFSNGYGASVIRHRYSYGNEAGLYELAVLGSDGHLNYETPITSDVEGYLAPDDVTALLKRIAALPAAQLAEKSA